LFVRGKFVEPLSSNECSVMLSDNTIIGGAAPTQNAEAGRNESCGAQAELGWDSEALGPWFR
jgi:hypothetical protein